MLSELIAPQQLISLNKIKKIIDLIDSERDLIEVALQKTKTGGGGGGVRGVNHTDNTQCKIGK